MEEHNGGEVVGFPCGILTEEMTLLIDTLVTATPI